MASFDVVGLNRSWVLFGNWCRGGVSSEVPEEIGISRDFLKQFPIEKDRGRSQRERERVLACSAFENFYNLQFSCKSIFFNKKNSRSSISTALQYKLPFFFSSFFFLFVLCFCLSDGPGHQSSSFSFCSDTLWMFLKKKKRYALAKRESEKTERDSLGCAVFGSVLS